MRRGFASRIALAFALPLGLACDNLGPSPCLDGVSFTIGAGTAPTFAWEPACRMQALIIRTVNDPNQSVVWAVSTTLGTNELRPPLRYGEIPPNANGTTPPPAPLTVGTSYRLTLYASFNDPTGGATQQAVDSVVFVP